LQNYPTEKAIKGIHTALKGNQQKALRDTAKRMDNREQKIKTSLDDLIRTIREAPLALQRYQPPRENLPDTTTAESPETSKNNGTSREELWKELRNMVENYIDFLEIERDDYYHKEVWYVWTDKARDLDFIKSQETPSRDTMIQLLKALKNERHGRVTRFLEHIRETESHIRETALQIVKTFQDPEAVVQTQPNPTNLGHTNQSQPARADSTLTCETSA
jgi:hypothetical protein